MKGAVSLLSTTAFFLKCIVLHVTGINALCGCMCVCEERPYILALVPFDLNMVTSDESRGTLQSSVHFLHSSNKCFHPPLQSPDGASDRYLLACPAANFMLRQKQKSVRILPAFLPLNGVRCGAEQHRRDRKIINFPSFATIKAW